MKRVILAFAILMATVMTGCAIKSRKMDIYTISVPHINLHPSSSRYRNSVLRVEYPNGTSETMGSRIYYREGDRESWYLYSRWSDSLNRMMLSIVVESLHSSGIFKDVIDYTSNSVSDYSLETTIYDFRHQIEGDSSYAYLKIGFRLLSSKTNRIIKSRIFEYKEECSQTNASGFVKAVKEINKKMARDLILWIAK